MDLGFTDATALVTGSKGMARAIGETLAAEGCSVAMFARGREGLDEAVAAMQALGAPDAVGIQVDVGDPEQIAAGVAELDRRWGRLNVIINTVGPMDGRFETLTDDDWATALNMGTMAAVRTIRAGLPLMRKADWGRIVNFSAHSTKRQNPGLIAYTASKAALVSLSKNLAQSLAPEGILVNVVSPGTIVTDSFTNMLRDTLAEAGLDSSNPHDVMKWVADTYHHPASMPRAGLPEEIASATVYLASKRNGYVTGANLNVDGGSDFS